MKALNPREKVHKTSATLTGVFFIIAAVASIIGLKLYDPVLTSEDYLIMGAQETNKIISGAIFELILACSAVGTGIMLYPHLKKHNESLGLGYVCFRLLEVVFNWHSECASTFNVKQFIYKNKFSQCRIF